MSAPPDKRFLLMVLIFGLVAAGASGRWLTSGEIVIRGGKAHGAPAPSGHSRVEGTIPRDHVLFYLVAISWGLLRVTMVTLAALAYFKSDHHLAKLCAYCCVAILTMRFATVGFAKHVGS